MESIHLYSIAVCPFAQRTRIHFKLKGLPFKLTEIDITKRRPVMYTLLMNQDRAKHAALTAKALETWRRLDQFLMRSNPDGTFLFASFGMADLSIATFFQRHRLNESYNRFSLHEDIGFARVRKWK